MIGNPLKSSPDFPPLCAERAAFTALGAPSNSDVRASNTTYTLRYSFISCCSEVNTGILSFRFGFSLSYSKLCLLCFVFLLLNSTCDRPSTAYLFAASQVPCHYSHWNKEWLLPSREGIPIHHFTDLQLSPCFQLSTFRYSYHWIPLGLSSKPVPGHL